MNKTINERPLVSVIMNCYNGETYLRESIDTIISQTYKNWEIINGVSFLPYDGGNYQLAPYEEIDHYTYESLIKKFPDINYNKLSQYELEDETQGSKEYACVGDKCDI